MRLYGAVGKIKTKLTLRQYVRLRSVWEFVNIAVINLNSFLLLYYRKENKSSMRYVICAGAAGYILIFLIESVMYRKNPKKNAVLQKTKNVFRLIYTAIYLTVIMLDVLAAAELPGTERLLSYYGWLFIWVTLWGTKCLWLKKAFYKIRLLIAGCISDAMSESSDKKEGTECAGETSACLLDYNKEYDEHSLREAVRSGVK